MRRWRSDTGFSLVEVMVVTAIIGLMAGAVVLSLPSDDKRLKAVGEGAERAFIALSRQSVLTGEPLGVRLSADGFIPLKLTDDGWQPDDSLLKPEALSWAPAEAVALQVMDAEIDLAAEGANPQVWFLPTGEQPPFRLTLALDARQAVLVGAGNGRFGIERHD